MGLMKKDVFLLSSAANCSWQVSSLSETKAHQVMQQKPASFIHFNQRQLSRIYPSSYRVDSSNFNPQPFWSAGCQLGTGLCKSPCAPWSLCSKLIHTAAASVINFATLSELLWFQSHSTTSLRAESSSSTEPNSTATATVATSSSLPACVKVSTKKDWSHDFSRNSQLFCFALSGMKSSLFSGLLI